MLQEELPQSLRRRFLGRQQRGSGQVASPTGAADWWLDEGSGADKADSHRKWFMLGVLVVWQVLSQLGWLDPRYIPAPTTVAAGMVELGADAAIRSALLQAAWMLSAAFTVAALGGVLIGVGIGLSKRAYSVVHPLVLLLFSTPKMIFLPIFLLVFGLGFQGKVVYAAISGLFPVIVAVAAGVRTVDQKLLTTARSMGATRSQMVWAVVVPASLPAVFAGVWFGLKHCLLGVLVMELFTSQQGIGYFVRRFTSRFESEKVFALVIVLSVFAILLGELWRQVERRLSAWRHHVSPGVS